MLNVHYLSYGLMHAFVDSLCSVISKNAKNGRCFTCIFTEEPMDYIGFSSILSFAACEIRECVNVSIVVDLVDEPVEEFDITLERTVSLDSRISLRPVDTRVIIHDNDGK